MDVNKVDTIVTGTEAVAQHFGVTKRSVYRWLREGMPRLSQKRFDLLQIQEWLERRKGIIRPGPEPGRGYHDPRQLSFADQAAASGKSFHDERLKKAKADLAEMEVKQRRGELVAKKDIYHHFVGRITVVKQGLLSLARSLPPRLIHCKTEREMEVIITMAVRELLENFSRPLPERLGSVAVDVDNIQAIPGGGGNGHSLADGGRNAVF